MSLIDDVIDLAHAHRLVIEAAPEPDGCDAYLLRTSPRPIGVWIRPDGRFSRAAADGEALTLGQVMNHLVQTVHEHDAPARPTTRHSRASLDS